MSLLLEVARAAHAETFRVTEEVHVGGIVVTFDMGGLVQEAHGSSLRACLKGPPGLSPMAVAAILRGVADAIDPGNAGLGAIWRVRVAEDVTR